MKKLLLIVLVFIITFFVLTKIFPIFIETPEFKPERSALEFLSPNLGIKIIPIYDHYYNFTDEYGRVEQKLNMTYINESHHPTIRNLYNISNGTEIRTWEDFKRFFAPVDNEKEAVAFAFAKANYSEPIYSSSEFFHGDIPLALILKGTHAEKVNDGYIVNLFEGECGWETDEVKYFVNKSGDVIFSGKSPIFMYLLSCFSI